MVYITYLSALSRFHKKPLSRIYHEVCITSMSFLSLSTYDHTCHRNIQCVCGGRGVERDVNEVHMVVADLL